MALHAKAKAEAGYRFYALYDKISRDDILAHAYAQCRSNKGAPGIDGQDFAEIEAYGVERWLTSAGADLRSRSSAGNLRLPRRAKRPAGSCRGGGAAVPGSPGRRRRRSRGLLREPSACRPAKVGGASDR